MQDVSLLLAPLTEFQERLGNAAAIPHDAFPRLNRLANELRAAVIVEVNRVKRIDPGIDERARQAMLQGRPGELMGRRHDD